MSEKKEPTLKEFFGESETYEVTVHGKKIKVLVDVPYPLAREIASKWMSKMSQGAVKGNVNIADAFDENTITDILDKILLNIVVEPKLTLEFIKSSNCPVAFIGLAMSRFTDVIEGIKSISGVGKKEKDEEEEDEVEVEEEKK